MGDILRSCGPTPLLKQGHLQQVALDQAHTAFKDIQGKRLHNRSANYSVAPSATAYYSKEVFPDVQMAQKWITGDPTTSCPGTRHRCKEPGSIFFAPSP